MNQLALTDFLSGGVLLRRGSCTFEGSLVLARGIGREQVEQIGRDCHICLGLLLPQFEMAIFCFNNIKAGQLLIRGALAPSDRLACALLGQGGRAQLAH